MDLIEEQHAAVRLLDEARLRLIRTRERTLHVAEDMRNQKLRVVVVVGTVERHKRRLLREAVHDLAVLEHHVREERLADARLADDQRVQAVGRVENSRLGLLDLAPQAPVRADEPREGILELLRRLRLADGLDIVELARHAHVDVVELALAERHAECRLQATPVKVEHRPPRELHDPALALQRVELLRDIVAQDAERLRNLLRPKANAPFEHFLWPGLRLLLDIRIDAFPSFHPHSPPYLNIHILL